MMHMVFVRVHLLMQKSLLRVSHELEEARKVSNNLLCLFSSQCVCVCVCVAGVGGKVQLDPPVCQHEEDVGLQE